MPDSDSGVLLVSGCPTSTEVRSLPGEEVVCLWAGFEESDKENSRGRLGEDERIKGGGLRKHEYDLS